MYKLCIYVCVCICMCVYIYMCVCVCVCVYVYVCMYMCVCVYIYCFFVPELHMYSCVIIAMCGVHNVKLGHISHNANI